jgi:hypothetical protein
MISRKLLHAVLQRLQVIMGLNEMAESTHDWHFYHAKTGAEIKQEHHEQLHSEVRALVELLKRHVKA